MLMFGKTELLTSSETFQKKNPNPAVYLEVMLNGCAGQIIKLTAFLFVRVDESTGSARESRGGRWEF